MINKVILIGNLGRDPEVRTLESGTKVAKFPIATNENYKDRSGAWQTRTEWHNIVAWTYLAEKAEQYLKKGSLVFIEGKLTHRKYTDKDGVDRYMTEVRTAVLKLLDKREDSGEGEYKNSSSENSSNDESSDPFSSDLSEENIAGVDEGEEEDDLPF